MRMVVVLVVVAIARLAAAQPAPDPADEQFTQTGTLKLYKAGKHYPQVRQFFWAWADGAENRRTERGARAARPAPASGDEGNQTKLYHVTDCKDQTCTQGGGSLQCWTIVNPAGTAWDVVTCSELDVRDFGATCGDATADSAAFAAMRDATGGVIVPDGCMLRGAPPGNGNAAFTLTAADQRVWCQGRSGLEASQRVCVGSANAGGYCVDDTWCPGGTCQGSAFAPAGVTATLLRAEQHGVIVQGCTLDHNGRAHDGAGNGYGACVGGSQVGMACRWFCSNDAAKACSSDGGCTGGGTCTKIGTCSGGACTGEAESPSGPGNVNAIDADPVGHPTGLNGVVIADVRLVDVRHGTELVAVFGENVVAPSYLRALDMAVQTRAALPTTGSPLPTPTQIDAAVGVKASFTNVALSNLVGKLALDLICIPQFGFHCTAVGNHMLNVGLSNGAMLNKQPLTAAIRVNGWHHNLIGNTVFNYPISVASGNSPTDIVVGDHRSLIGASLQPSTLGGYGVLRMQGAGWNVTGGYLVGNGTTCDGGGSDGAACTTKCDGGANVGVSCSFDVECPSATCDGDVDCGGGVACIDEHGVIEFGVDGGGGAGHSFVNGAEVAATTYGAVYRIANTAAASGQLSITGTQVLAIGKGQLHKTPARALDASAVTVGTQGLVFASNHLSTRAGVKFPSDPWGAGFRDVRLEGNTYRAPAGCTDATSPVADVGKLCTADGECGGSGTCNPVRYALQVENWDPRIGFNLERGLLPVNKAAGGFVYRYDGTITAGSAVTASTSVDDSVAVVASGANRFLGIATGSAATGYAGTVLTSGVTSCRYSGTAPARGGELRTGGTTAGTLRTDGSNAVVAEALAAGSGGLVSCALK
jgi:hypothetical protein